jgi:hypothetical protein
MSTTLLSWVNNSRPYQYRYASDEISLSLIQGKKAQTTDTDSKLESFFVKNFNNI